MFHCQPYVEIPSEIFDLGISATDAKQRVGLIEEMVFDTDLSKRLARVPSAGAPKREVDRWLTSFEILSARARARASMSGQSGTGQIMPDRLPAALRQVIGTGVVNSGNGNGGVR